MHSVLKRVIGEGHAPEKAVFELRLVSNECAHHTHVWGESILDREGQVQGPKVALSLVCSRHSKIIVPAEVQCQESRL